MKKAVKTIIICTFTVTLISLWAFRFYSVNQNVASPTTKIYAQGEVVPYENDFFHRDDESRNGYEITVVSATLMTYKKFVTLHNKTEEYISSDKIHPVYIYDIEISVKNNNTQDDTTKGIDLINTRLVTTNDSMQVNEDLFDLLYPDLSGQFGFSLRPESEMIFHLPYATYESDLTEKKILSKDWYLLISMYPTKKMIRVKNT